MGIEVLPPSPSKDGWSPSQPSRQSAGQPSAPFVSILFEGPGSPADGDRREAPAYFPDLNLDQVVESLTAGREEYDLKPFFYQRLASAQAVRYRHEVLRDLEDEQVLGSVTSFAQSMREMRESLTQAGKLRHKHQKESWFLDAMGVYCSAAARLARELSLVELRSRGLRGFREYLSRYVVSPAFTSLMTETERLKADLARVQYCVRIRENRVVVSRYDEEADYSADVLSTFERFKQGTVKDYRVGFSDWPEMNHVEERILDLVALLFDTEFSSLDEYRTTHRGCRDRTIRRFDREVQFYVAFLEYMERFRSAGLTFSYPEMSQQSKEVFVTDTFDLALADNLVPQGAPVVCNDLHLQCPERIFVVTGPNQGGKTTFARTFGQLHHLASIGCPVPGNCARLFLFEQMFTHFEKEEDLANMSGKLEDDLVRIRDVLSEATTDSIVILNEIFTSTTLHDARFLGTKVIEKIIQLDLLCVYVTFVDELALLDPSIVSMVSTVVPGNPAQRTFRIVRQPADGIAHAVAIAEKYGLTYDQLKRRIAS